MVKFLTPPPFKFWDESLLWKKSTCQCLDPLVFICHQSPASLYQQKAGVTRDHEVRHQNQESDPSTIHSHVSRNISRIYCVISPQTISNFTNFILQALLTSDIKLFPRSELSYIYIPESHWSSHRDTLYFLHSGIPPEVKGEPKHSHVIACVFQNVCAHEKHAGVWALWNRSNSCVGVWKRGERRCWRKV